MSDVRANILVGFVRTAAPIFMTAAALLAAVGGVAFYFTIGALAHSVPIDIPEAVAMPLYAVYVASPAFIGLMLLGTVSAGLYRQDSPNVPRPLLHLWHCAILYPVAGGVLFLVLTCPGSQAPVPGRCADPFGTSMAAGLVAFAGILADAVTAFRRRQPLVAPAG